MVCSDTQTSRASNLSPSRKEGGTHARQGQTLARIATQRFGYTRKGPTPVQKPVFDYPFYVNGTFLQVAAVYLGT
jgi:hypothetical protein